MRAGSPEATTDEFYLWLIQDLTKNASRTPSLLLPEQLLFFLRARVFIILSLCLEMTVWNLHKPDCGACGCKVPRRSARSFIKAKKTGTRIRT